MDYNVFFFFSQYLFLVTDAYHKTHHPHTSGLVGGSVRSDTHEGCSGKEKKRKSKSSVPCHVFRGVYDGRIYIRRDSMANEIPKITIQPLPHSHCCRWVDRASQEFAGVLVSGSAFQLLRSASDSIKFGHHWELRHHLIGNFSSLVSAR